MTLLEAIRAAGMTPPQHIVPGRWVRFPGIGKGRRNRAGWCRLITPTLAIFGDWSSDMRSTWKDDGHQDDARTAEALRQARLREITFARELRARQMRAAQQADVLISRAKAKIHPYLARKGFPEELALTLEDGTLLVPMHSVHAYRQIVGVQQIKSDGGKEFLPGTKARGGIYRIGSPFAPRVLLCEGYATGLTLEAAAKRLPGPFQVVVCFSAHNLQIVANAFPGALVCADNDPPKQMNGREVGRAGERAAIATGLKWTMPEPIGFDFNDLMLRDGLWAVTNHLRRALAT